MEKTVLSQRNCHRASVVRKIDDPDLGDAQFDWRGERINDNIMCPEFCHLAKFPTWDTPTRIYDTDDDMHNWEVVAWRYEVNLQHLWENAVRAFYGTSFSPEKRAAQYIRDYEAALNGDLTHITEDEHARYIDKFTDWVRTIFDKHSRIMSTMITGPANFPTRRNEKMNTYYDSAVEEFTKWRERSLKASDRRAENAKPQEQKDEEAWQTIRREIGLSAQTIIDINNGMNHSSSKSLFVSSIYGKVERLARHGNVALVEKSIAYIRGLNEKSTVINERHKFFKLLDVARAVQSKQDARAQAVDKDVAFDGGVVRFNYTEDRLQILFKEKPDSQMIGKLKRAAFKWSPRFGAWQRQLTANAKYSAHQVLNIDTL